MYNNFRDAMVGKDGYLDDFEVLSAYAQCAIMDPANLNKWDRRIGDLLNEMVREGTIIIKSYIFYKIYDIFYYLF